jgi:hypothetical protein
METFPIAGQIINTKLTFGLTARDIGEALVLPFLGLGSAQSLGASGNLFLIATGIALALGIVILLITPAAQRPLSYARACVHFYLGTTTYRNCRTQVTIDEAHYLLRRAATTDLIDLFIRHSRHFNTGLTLISQTVDEFLVESTEQSADALEKAREIYNLCNIKQIFRHESVSEEMIAAHDLTHNEQRFIASAQTGEDGTHSESLLLVNDWKKRIQLHVDEFAVHVLDEDLDPWEYLIEQNALDTSDVSYLLADGRAEEYDIPQSLLEQAREFTPTTS